MPTADADAVKVFIDYLLKDIGSIPTRTGRIIAYSIASLIALIYVVGTVLSLVKGAQWGWLIVVAATVTYIFKRAIKRDSPTPVNHMLLAGPSPIGPAQGAFVKTWGRQSEIRRLLEWVTGEEVAVIMIWGEPAVGKTSLVNAGLRSELALSQWKFFSVDASQEFEGSLVSQLRGEGGNVPKSLDQIITSDRKRKQIIVFDNASFARSDGLKKLIQLTKLALGQNAPYKRVLVVVVDDFEFRAIWQKEEWNPRSRVNGLKKLAVTKFSLDQAMEVAQSLKREASIRVDDEVIIEGVRDLSEPNSSPELEPVISPLALSIFLFLVASEVEGGREFGIEEYVSSGRARGLMAAYLANQLSVWAPRFWRDIMSRIAAEAKIFSTFNESKFDDLAEATQEVKAALEGLSSPELRVLRFDSGSSEYRVHAAWVSVVASMHNRRDAEVLSAEDFLKTRYLEWRQRSAAKRNRRRGKTWRYGHAKYLLTRGELKIIGRFEGRLNTVGGRREYVSLSKEYRGGQLLVSCILLISLIPAIVAASQMMVDFRNGSKMEGAGIPVDFSRHGSAIKHVSLVSGCYVEELSWLPRNLERLDAACGRITSLEGIPPRLTHLNVSATAIKDLKQLPKSVTDLNISSTSIPGDVALGDLKLKNLNLSGLRVNNLKLLPQTLISLVLSNPEINSIEWLPEGLQALELNGTSVKSLEGLPSGLRSLKFKGNAGGKIDYLPPHLESLEIDRSLEEGVQFPASLRVLNVSHAFLPQVPDSINSLELSEDVSLGGKLPEGLERLWINSRNPSVTLEQIPAGLKVLKLVWPAGAKFEKLPKALSVLDLTWSLGVSELSGIKAPITALTLTNTDVKSFRHLPGSITSLTVHFCVMNEVKELPAHLRALDLSGCDHLELLEKLPSSLEVLNLSLTAITSLPSLPQQLRRLDISNTKIHGALPKLPAKLEELTIHFGQFESIKGIPSSVKRLIFVGDEKKLVLEEREP